MITTTDTLTHLSSLRTLQSWFQAMIMQGQVADLSHIAASPPLSREQRLGIYQDAYVSRLTECLENEFPVLLETVGKEAFAQFVFGYLQEFPSRSYTLGRLSGHFVEYLSTIRPAHEDTSLSPDWFDFVIDLARFEEAINLSFDGPGFESQIRDSPLPPRDTGSKPADIQLKLNPSLKLIHVRFPVHLYYQQLRKGLAASFPAHRDTSVAVYRRDFVVRYRAISCVQEILLKSIRKNWNLNEVIRHISRSTDPSITPEAIRESMQLFVEEAMICKLLP